jgi:DNA-binding NtrC family response regulator
MKNCAKPALLCVTESAPLARQIVKVTSEWLEVFHARTPEQATALLDLQKNIAIIVTESDVGDVTGIQILEAAQAQRPDVRRVLLTEYRDLSLLVQGLHSGVVQKSVEKPLREREFLATVLPPRQSVGARAASSGRSAPRPATQ